MQKILDFSFSLLKNGRQTPKFQGEVYGRIGLIVIDEIQRKPELFPTLRVLCDNTPNNQQFLILGRASRELLQKSSESLAGRIQYIEITPFSYSETKNMKQLWLRGGFPPSYLASSEDKSAQMTKSMHIAMKDLHLDSLTVIYPGTKPYPLSEKQQRVSRGWFAPFGGGV